jgi:GcrA cell cycle regulator
MVWDAETIRHLRELWTQGHSTAEIGRRLNVSKNAIVGKAHRLELEARPSPIRRDGPKPAAERAAAYPRVAGPTLPPLASADVATPNLAAVGLRSEPHFDQAGSLRAILADSPRTMAARPSLPLSARVVMPAVPIQARRSAPSCCWPIGEPGTKTFRFCDDTSVPGKPYCDEHAKLAYVKIRDRREDAA